MANWDTAYGYELYCKGLSDGEIADECKVKISTVKAMRLNKWRKKPDGGRGAPPLMRSSCLRRLSTSVTPPPRVAACQLKVN